MRRLFSLLLNTLLMLAAVPFVISIRLLSSFVIIRLRYLDVGRVGGFYVAEWYLCERKQGLHNGFFDIFYAVSSTGIVSNYQLLKMWKRAFLILPPGRLFKAVDKLNKLFPGHQKHAVSVDTKNWPPQERTIRSMLDYAESLLSFTEAELKAGEIGLRDLGITNGREFICFHARDAAYLKAVNPHQNWSYHDYRDSNIINYVQATQDMARRGYYAVRMGAIVKDKLNIKNDAIIDYATNGNRSDFMDVYLSAKCRFMISSETGLHVIPSAFRRPIIFTNYVLLNLIFTWCNNCLFIPKKFYSRDKKRFLTFKEILNSRMCNAYDSKIFEENQIDLIENTPEEISDVAVEMDERLKGTWETTKDDDGLQQQFWDIFGADKIRSSTFRMGSLFLRRNQNLLN